MLREFLAKLLNIQSFVLVDQEESESGFPHRESRVNKSLYLGKLCHRGRRWLSSTFDLKFITAIHLCDPRLDHVIKRATVSLIPGWVNPITWWRPSFCCLFARRPELNILFAHLLVFSSLARLGHSNSLRLEYLFGPIQHLDIDRVPDVLQRHMFRADRKSVRLSH